MNEVQIFNFKENSVRTQYASDEVWFCLKDVCDVLEIKNSNDVVSRINPKGVASIYTLTKGGNQKLTYINESNLYKVIFQSRKPQAEEFTEWVTGEVLPTIRKTGSYSLQKDSYMIEDPIERAKRWIEEQEERKALENENKAMKPKARFAEAVGASEESILIGQLAKIIKQNGVDIGQNRLFQWMRDNDYLIKNGTRYNQPTQKAMELGLFEVKERTVNNPDGSVRITFTTKVTGKGQVYFVNKFLNA